MDNHDMERQNGSHLSGFDQLDDAVTAALDELGPVESWTTPSGYPNSLAICVIDSIFSLGIRYEAVVNVIRRYVSARSPGTGIQDLTDGPDEFLVWYESVGSADAAATALGSRNRTSSKGGVLKVEAVAQACNLLAELGVHTTSALLARSEEIEQRWRSQVKGQRSGLSWQYLLMLAGGDGIKADRMLERFTERHLADFPIDSDGFIYAISRRLNQAIARKVIDHRIWSIERTREDPGTSFESLSHAIAEFAVDRDWTKFHTLPNLLIALMGEVGEVAELVQWRSPEELAATLSSEDSRTRLAEELADVLIYLVRMAHVAGLNLLEAADRKLAVNEAKYPIDVSRGSAVKYSERGRQ